MLLLRKVVEAKPQRIYKSDSHLLLYFQFKLYIPYKCKSKNVLHVSFKKGNCMK